MDHRKTMLEKAQLYAELFSDDPHRKVGVVIVTELGQEIRGTNRLPVGVAKLEWRLQKPLKYGWIVHAECDAIHTAAASGVSLTGATMFLPWFPCAHCAQAIVNSGIGTLHCHAPDLNDDHWGADFQMALAMLNEKQVEVRFQ